jgi:hypothetical protein
LTATALNNIHTQKASSKQATDIHRFLRAMALPLFSQNALFSGRQFSKGNDYLSHSAPTYCPLIARKGVNK